LSALDVSGGGDRQEDFSPQVAVYLHHEPAQRRGRTGGHQSPAGPREHRHDADLHERGAGKNGESGGKVMMLVSTMGFRRLLFCLLLFIQFWLCLAAIASTVNDNKDETILDAPISIGSEKGNLFFKDKNGRIVKLNGSQYFNINVEIGWRIYIPVIAAVTATIITLLSSIYLSWINHIQIKKQKWYNSWSERVLSLNDQLYSLVNGAMFSRSEYPSHKIDIEITKIKIQICSHIGILKKERLTKLLDSLQMILEKENPYEGRDDIFKGLEEIAAILFDEVKNG